MSFVESFLSCLCPLLFVWKIRRSSSLRLPCPATACLQSCLNKPQPSRGANLMSLVGWEDEEISSGDDIASTWTRNEWTHVRLLTAITIQISLVIVPESSFLSHSWRQNTNFRIPSQFSYHALAKVLVLRDGELSIGILMKASQIFATQLENWQSEKFSFP